MARLDIEDQFFLDLMCVIEKMGDQDRAAGNALRFLRYSQEKHRKGKLLTEDEFKARGFNEALIGVFAERVEGGIQAIGAKKHFGWLDKKVSAGKKGGRSKTEAKTKHLKQNKANESAPKQKVAKGSITEPPLSPSPSLSYSSTSTNTPKFMATTEVAPMNPMAIYISAYQEKYGHRPEVGPREGKILKTFAENHPGRWEELIRGYLQMPDSWAVQRSHPVEVLVAKVNEIGRFLATGKVVTKKVIQHAEEIIDKAQGTLRRPRKSIEELERERAEMLAEANVVPMIGGAK